jgi:hypothetical protein
MVMMSYIKVFSLFTKNTGVFPNKFKLFLFLLIACAFSPVYPAYSSPKGCSASFTVGNVTTDFIDLGDVGGFLANKKKRCLEKAIGYGRSNLRYETFGFTGQEVCNYSGGGSIAVYVDTDVEGKRNSRDGSFNTNFQANCGPCVRPYEGDSR